MSFFRTREETGFFEQLKKRYPHPVLLVSNDGIILDSNQHSNAVVNEWDSDDFDKLREVVRNVCETGESYPYYFTMNGEDSTLHYQANIVSFENSDKVIVYFYDISTDARLRLTLIESRQRYKELVEISSEFAWETDEQGRFVFVSPKGAIGWTPESLIGYPARDFIQELNQDNINPFSTKSICEQIELWFLQPNGKKACLLVDSIPIYDSSGDWHGVRGVCHDVTMDKIRETEINRLQQRERTMTKIIQALRDNFHPKDRLEQTAKILCNTLGLRYCALQNFTKENKYEEIINYGNSDRNEEELFKIKTYYHSECNGQIILDVNEDDYEDKNDFLSLMDDVAVQVAIMIEQLNYQEKLEYYSNVDTLTKILNRRAFFDQLDVRMKHALRTGRKGALVYIDLDNFKHINDSQGHATGDEVLIDFSQCLTENKRVADIVGRLGGDEFAVWLEETDGIGAKSKAANIMDECQSIFKHYRFDDQNPLNASIGIAVYDPRFGEELKDLVARADEIMYEVKHAGKGNIKVQELNGNGERQDV